MKSINLFYLLILLFLSTISYSQTADWNNAAGNDYSEEHLGLNIDDISTINPATIELPLTIFGTSILGSSPVIDLPGIRFSTFLSDDELFEESNLLIDILGGRNLTIISQVDNNNPVDMLGISPSGIVTTYNRIEDGNGPGRFGIGTNGNFEIFMGSLNSSFVAKPNGEFLFGNHAYHPAPSVVKVYGELRVAHKIYANEIEVQDPVTMADYVFESDYDLKTIKEVSAYIDKNKHLPGIPTAKEFAENGYSVSDMDRMLLEKIEELTLYVIQLEAKINE